MYECMLCAVLRKGLVWGCMVVVRMEGCVWARCDELVADVCVVRDCVCVSVFSILLDICVSVCSNSSAN